MHRLLFVALLLATPALADPPGLDQVAGQHFEILAENLPEPQNPPYVSNGPERIPRGALTPIVPDGFTITLFAENLLHPRRLLVLSDGSVLLVQQQPGQIVRFVDADNDGVAESGAILGQGFRQPFGLVEIPVGPWTGDLLVGDVDAIWHIPYKTGGTISQITPDGAFGTPQGHITRTLAIDPETGRFYVGVGSMANLAEEDPPKATVLRFDLDGLNQTIFAIGLRNATGLRLQPETGDLYAVVMERDGMGDGLVPDYFSRVAEADNFGWPYQYSGGFVQPEFRDHAPKLAAAKLPDVMFEAHSAPMDLIFLPATWPEDFRGDAVVALKGSSNRQTPTGYKLVRIPFDNDRPTGGYDNFVTGFWTEGETSPKAWGRPAALALTADGGLLVADDFGGTIWKILPSGP